MFFLDHFPALFFFVVSREYIFGDFNRQILVFMQKVSSDIFGLKCPQDLRVPRIRICSAKGGSTAGVVSPKSQVFYHKNWEFLGYFCQGGGRGGFHPFQTGFFGQKSRI